MLRKLIKAKLTKAQVLERKPAKKLKKRLEDKPTLIVAKVNGVYHVELKAVGENAAGRVDKCQPLKYKIASADNEAKIRNRETRQRRLIRRMRKEIGLDYDLDACAKRCWRAFWDDLPHAPDNLYSSDDCENSADLDSCSCLDEEVSSSSGSLDVDWEIHFTPPIACHEPEQVAEVA